MRINSKGLFYSTANLGVQKTWIVWWQHHCLYPQTQFSWYGYVPLIFTAREQNTFFVHCSALGLRKSDVHGCLASLGLKSVYMSLLSQCFNYLYNTSRFCSRTVQLYIANCIQKIESAEKDSGAAAKLFITYYTPRLALPKNIPLELIYILSFLGWQP